MFYFKCFEKCHNYGKMEVFRVSILVKYLIGGPRSDVGQGPGRLELQDGVSQEGDQPGKEKIINFVIVDPKNERDVFNKNF